MTRIKLILLGAVVLSGILLSVILYIRDSGRNAEKLENLNSQIETRTRIDESIRRAPRDVDAALELLRQRQDR